MINQVDTTTIKVNQAFIVALLVVAFVLNWPWLVLFVGAVMIIGTAWPDAALFQQIYRRILKPAGLLRPHVIDDDPVPHRFAQGMGGTFLLLASLFLLVLHVFWLGWALAILVAILAAVNLVFSFCAGCFVYYQLARLGIIRRSVPTP